MSLSLNFWEFKPVDEVFAGGAKRLAARHGNELAANLEACFIRQDNFTICLLKDDDYLFAGVSKRNCKMDPEDNVAISMEVAFAKALKGMGQKYQRPQLMKFKIRPSVGILSQEEIEALLSATEGEDNFEPVVTAEKPEEEAGLARSRNYKSACSVEGCRGLHNAKGLCVKHYQAHRREIRMSGKSRLVER